MKAIELLSNVEKAQLLHQLFPSEIPDFIRFVAGMCATIQEDKQIVATWDNGLLDIDTCHLLVYEAERKIKHHDIKLHKSSKAFAELFDGTLAIFMVHCLITYTTIRVHPNQKFVLATDLFFNA